MLNKLNYFVTHLFPGIHQSAYNHTALKNHHRLSDSVDSGMEEVLEPCCVPGKLSDIYIVMAAEGGGVVQRILTNVVVSKCECR